jgi:anaerobic ribonucleoside-triphosphate reductase activating protein
LDLIAPWLSEADGLTISGGEPFDQPAALAGLLQTWRQRSDRSAFVYTGYELDAVADWLSGHDGLIDALMTGPFKEATPQTLALRGSDNQTLHVLTPLGNEFRQYERVTTQRDKRLDAMFGDEGKVFFAGIPARGDFQKLGDNLRREGHRAQLSQQQLGRRK